MSENIIDTKLKEDVKKVFEKNSDNIQYVHDVLLPDQKLNIKVEYNQEVVYKKLLQSKKAAQIALNLYNANEIYKNLKILTELDLKNPCENENPEDNNDPGLKNPCKKKSSYNSCSQEPRFPNKSDSKSSNDESSSDDSSSDDRVKQSKSSLINPCEKESCINPSSDEPRVHNKSYSNNSHDEEPSDDHDHVGKSQSSLPNSHNEEHPIGESFCVDKRDKSEVIDKLYQYVFYFLIARNLEIINFYKTTVGKERSGNLICQMCDTNISSTDLECSGCQESLLTIYEKEIDKYEKSKFEEIKITKNRDTDSVANKEVINRDDNKHKTNTNRETDSVANKELINRDDNKHKTNTNRETDSVANKEVINRDDNKHKTNTNRNTDSVANKELINRDDNKHKINENRNTDSVVNKELINRDDNKHKINENRNTDSVVNKEVINRDDNKHDKESGSQLAGCHGEVNSDGIKWKCKHCGVGNEDENVNCTVCMVARAEWNCRKCTFANEISSEKCELCGELRENKADNNNDDNREKDGRTESWICWFGGCKKRNGGNELYCTHCGLDKSANRQRGAIVDMIRYGKIEQVWICYACNHINYELDRSICYKCDHISYELNKSICYKCDHISYELNKSICYKCHEFKFDVKGESINKDNNKNVEKYGRTESWICWYRKCQERNDGNELYCTHCGLDKLANRERGAAVEMIRYGKIEQVWICYACDHINYDLYRSICYKCGESKFDVKGESDNGKDKIIDEYVMIERDEDNNKWKCSKCQCGNDRESLSCKQCQSPRIEMWSCKHCTMRNQISNDHCAACGKENENKTIKYCSKCKHGEIICDDLCGDCLNARDETWTCWYRLCENRNAGNVKYCKDCGLDRYADKINIGAPMWRCKGYEPVEIWICYICSHINDISNNPYFCQNYPKHSCPGRNKYTKRCHKCWYKYNHEYSKLCEMCKEIMSWI